MYIPVGKTAPGPLNWILVFVGLLAFILSLFHGFFGPLGISMVVLGAVAAVFIAWRSRAATHPSLTAELRRDSGTTPRHNPIEPK